MDSIKTMKKLGVSIKRLRKKAGLSQTELSSLTGLRQATISKVESTGSGQIESLMRIIQALNSSISLDSEKVGGEKSFYESLLGHDPSGIFEQYRISSRKRIDEQSKQQSTNNFKVKKDE